MDASKLLTKKIHSTFSPPLPSKKVTPPKKTNKDKNKNKQKQKQKTKAKTKAKQRQKQRQKQKTFPITKIMLTWRQKKRNKETKK